MARRATLEEFIEKSQQVHGIKYDYSKVIYNNNHSNIELVCPSHGSFWLRPKPHLGKYKQGCPVCGIGMLNYHAKTIAYRKTHDEFLAEAKAIHGDKYDYSRCVYVGGKVKMPIICRVHGEFLQHAEGHINSKQGCLKCYHDSRKGKGGGGYALDYFEIHPEKREIPGIVYIARMQHKNDDFLKIGITAKAGVVERFYYKAMHGTIITPLYEHKTTLFEAFSKEQEILKSLKPERYFPNRRFSGYTECFKINPSTISTLNEYFGINISIPTEY